MCTRLLAIGTLALAANAAAAAQAPREIPAVRLDGVAGTQGVQPLTLPALQLDDRDRGADLDGQRSVSLTFSEPLPVRDVLLLLFRATPFSVVFDPAVTQSFAGELSGLTLRQALEAVLVPAGLDYSIKGTTVRVHPRRPESRFFDVNHDDVRRAWHRRTSGPGFDLSAATDADFFTLLGDGVRALLSPSGRMHLDRHAGVVQVTDFADRLDQIGLYIEAVTMRAHRQVHLHARVLEIRLRQEQPVDWTAVADRAGAGIRSGAGVVIHDFEAMRRALAAFGEVRTRSAPQVLATNNMPAVIRVGDADAVFDGDAADAVWRGPSAPPRGSGFSLTVVAQIGSDGIVHMSVSPTIVEGAGPASRVEADTTVRVRSGETAVVAGLLRDRIEDAPSVRPGSVPGAVERNMTRTELIVLLTPTVVTPGGSPAAGAR